MAIPMPVAPSRVRLPDPAQVDFAKPDQVRAYMEQLNIAVSMALAARAATAHPIHERLMFAPNGNTWAIVVADDGTLSTELRQQVSP